jgi:hypothetical protein
LASGVSKAIPVIGGVISGTINFASMMPMARKLNDTLDKAIFDYSDEEFEKDIESLSNETGEVSEEEKQSFKEKFAEGLNKTKDSVSNLFSKFGNNKDKIKTDPIEEIKKYKELLDSGIINQEEFDKKKKEYNKLSSPVILNQVKSLTGELKVTVNKEKETYFQNIKDNIDLNENLLQKITKSYKALILLMEQLSDKMKEIAEIWKEIYKKNIKYYEKQNTTTSYNIMSKIMLDWAEINKKQRILINEGIREYFRYIKNELHAIKDLSVKVDTNKTIYSKAFDKLMALKENVFKQDISTWGLTSVDMENKLQLLTNKNLAFSKMLPRDTKKVDELRQNYGFYLNSIISEFERIKDLNSKRHKNNINNFIKNIIESLNEFQNYLTDRASYYDEVKEEDNDKDNNEEQNTQPDNNNEE